MNVPVIIVANNEGNYIGRTLEALPGQGIDPIVAVNGTSDNTAEIARNFGAEVYEFGQAGKDAAFRRTLRLMGDRALERIITLDADSTPLVGRCWLNAMLKGVDSTGGDASCAAVGLLGYRPHSTELLVNPSTLVRTFRRISMHRRVSNNDSYYPCGANTAYKLTREVRDEIIESKQLYWPGEDRYYLDVIARGGGSVRQLTDIRSLVLASDRSLPPLVSRIVNGSARTKEAISSSYADRGTNQPGAVVYRGMQEVQ